MLPFSKKFLTGSVATVLIFSLFQAQIVHAQPDGNTGTNDGYSGGITIDGQVVEGSIQDLAAIMIDLAIMVGCNAVCGALGLGYNAAVHGLDFSSYQSWGGAITGGRGLGLGTFMGGSPSSGGGSVGTGSESTALDAAVSAAIDLGFNNSQSSNVTGEVSDNESDDGRAFVEASLGIMPGAGSSNSSNNNSDGSSGNNNSSGGNNSGGGGEGGASAYYDWTNFSEKREEDLRRGNRYFDVSFVADKQEFSPGENLTLSWQSEIGRPAPFRPVCRGVGADGGWAGSKESSGSQVISSIPANRSHVSFMLICSRQVIISRSDTAGGDDVGEEQGIAAITIPVRNATPVASTTPGRPQTAPVQPAHPQTAGDSGGTTRGLSINVSPSTVTSGGQATLSWSAEGQRSCVFR